MFFVLNIRGDNQNMRVSAFGWNRTIVSRVSVERSAVELQRRVSSKNRTYISRVSVECSKPLNYRDYFRDLVENRTQIYWCRASCTKPLYYKIDDNDAIRTRTSITILVFKTRELPLLNAINLFCL